MIKELNLFNAYVNNSQKIRILSENWVCRYIFCPQCGKEIKQYKNNKPVADFYCQDCKEDYELKSQKDKIKQKILSGSYESMIERIASDRNPNFFFLSYNQKTLDVNNFLIVPKHFFSPKIIEKRKPLSQNARRSGWVGCNILLNTIPKSGKIFYIQNGYMQDKNKILDQWQKMIFLKDSKDLSVKSWLLDIIGCIEKINKETFSLSDMYRFENILSLNHPNNNNIKAKIRQQLQFLRDKNYINFESRGRYSLSNV